MFDRFIATKAFISDSKGKILTIRRSITDPRKPLTWDLPGGFVELGENPNNAMVREIQEEVGLTTEKPQIFHVDSSTDNIFIVLLFYSCQTDQKNVELSFEHDIYIWVTRDEFLELNTQPAYKEAIKRIPINKQ